jgi:predicted transcriptional regulator
MTITTTPETVRRAADIRVRRRALRISRTALAVYAGCSLSHLQNIEQGAIPTHGDVVPKVLAALDELETQNEIEPGVGAPSSIKTTADAGGGQGAV